MTFNGRTGMSLEWNDLGLVKKVSLNDTVLVNYSYLADGTKMYRKDMHHDGHIYRGSFVYRLESGVVRWIEGSDEHRLYSVDSLGNRSVDYVEVKDRNILDALTDKKGVASYTSSTNIDDFFKVFLFASDNSNVEWALHRGQDNSYTIGTSHKEGGVAAYSVLSKVDELPIASLHSHPDVVTHKKERESMGYDEGWVQYANDRQKVYWGVVPKYNYVYFPISKTLYNVEYDNPRYVKHINTFKDFYFGTLNYR